MSPVETLIDRLIAGYTYEQAIEVSGFTRKEADNYLKRFHPKLYEALTKEDKQVKQPQTEIVVTRTTRDGQLLTHRPSWYTGQSNNKHVPVSHVVFLPTVRVLDGPGHLTQLPPGYVIIHKDWDRSNCELSNLEMITRSEATTRNNIRRHQLPCESV